MSNFKKSLEYQQKINEAVESIFEHFKKKISYAESLETMADAQIDIMEMMEVNRTIASCPSLELESIPTNTINTFLYEANQVYKLLRPFARLLGQVYGNDD